jgi:hypothetical protein
MKAKEIDILIKCKCCESVLTRVLGFSTDRTLNDLIEDYYIPGKHIISIEIEEIEAFKEIDK